MAFFGYRIFLSTALLGVMADSRSIPDFTLNRPSRFPSFPQRRRLGSDGGPSDRPIYVTTIDTPSGPTVVVDVGPVPISASLPAILGAP